MQDKKDKKTVNNMLVKHNVKPVVTALLKNHRKVMLGIVHTLVCTMLGIKPNTADNLKILAKVTATYLNVAVAGKVGTLVDDDKQTTSDGKKLNGVYIKHATQCLMGTASACTYSKYKHSLAKLKHDTSVIADYFAYFCASKKLDVIQAKTKAQKTDYVKKSIYCDTIKTALLGVKAS